MQILDYNRIIKDLNGLTESQLLSSIKSNFLLVWNEHMKLEAKNYLDYNEEHIFIAGAALYDFIFEQ